MIEHTEQKAITKIKIRNIQEQSFKDKNIILKNVNKLKGSDLYINEDFSRETLELRKKLWEEVKQLCSEGKFAYLNYRSIITRDQTKNNLTKLLTSINDS